MKPRDVLEDGRMDLRSLTSGSPWMTKLPSRLRMKARMIYGAARLDDPPLFSLRCIGMFGYQFVIQP